MTLCSDHPPRMRLVRACPFGSGMLYVSPVENAWRMSKSDGPRFALELVPIPALDESCAEPAEPVSSECAHV